MDNKDKKKQQVEKLKSDFAEAGAVIVTHYLGLTVEEITELRSKLRESGASFKVTKNSLAKLALEGTPFEQLKDYFTGPTAVAISPDPVSAAKGVVEFANDNDKLVVIGGALVDQALDKQAINTLAKLPSLDELRAKLLSLINTPATRIAGVVQAPAGQIARVIQAYSQK